MANELMLPLSKELIAALGAIGRSFIPSGTAAKTAFVDMMKNPEITIAEATERANAIRNYNYLIEEQNKNFFSVLQCASNYLDNNKSELDPHTTQEIDESWLLDFYEKSRNISSADIQQLWGIILAEKVTGSRVSKQLLRVLYEIEHDEAMLFTHLVSYSVSVWKKDGEVEMVPCFHPEVSFKSPRDDAQLVERLITCNLLERKNPLDNPKTIKALEYYDEGVDYERYYNILSKSVSLIYHDLKDPVFDEVMCESMRFASPPVKFTPIGKELSTMIKTEKLSPFFNSLLKQHAERQIEIVYSHYDNFEKDETIEISDVVDILQYKYHIDGAP